MAPDARAMSRIQRLFWLSKKSTEVPVTTVKGNCMPGIIKWSAVLNFAG
jgi:hypothetical protein